ncbi:MAG: TIGR04211 family SH3 domain-containing protein [Desulfuromonadales bacterium]|nr:TIGR04211 family SH3 domain-containing protein [Desulfuromonadales bacterium]NIS42758.1 TIGR04211 family SH3 domain-containing protein [Desulfuromonadales bacterium]
MRQSFLVLFIAGSVLLSAVDARAETQYISDRLLVSLRDAPSDQYTPLDTLASNTPVEVLGEEGRYVHVRTEKGLEGYIPAQYLMQETPGPVVIGRLRSRIAEYEKQVATLREQLREEKGDLAETLQSEQAKVRQLQQELAEAREELATVNSELASVRERYEQLQKNAENVVEITQERDRLDTRVNELLGEIQVLEKENDTLLRSGVIKWFVAGGGVFFVGWISGKVSRKKKGAFG